MTNLITVLHFPTTKTAHQFKKNQYNLEVISLNAYKRVLEYRDSISKAIFDMGNTKTQKKEGTIAGYILLLAAQISGHR